MSNIYQRTVILGPREGRYVYITFDYLQIQDVQDRTLKGRVRKSGDAGRFHIETDQSNGVQMEAGDRLQWDESQTYIRFVSGSSGNLTITFLSGVGMLTIEVKKKSDLINTNIINLPTAEADTINNNINVAAPENPDVTVNNTVNIPTDIANITVESPDVDVDIAATKVDVAAPDVTVESPMVTVESPEVTVESPTVNVTTPEVNVTVEPATPDVMVAPRITLEQPQANNVVEVNLSEKIVAAAKPVADPFRRNLSDAVARRQYQGIIAYSEWLFRSDDYLNVPANRPAGWELFSANIEYFFDLGISSDELKKIAHVFVFLPCIVSARSLSYSALIQLAPLGGREIFSGYRFKVFLDLGLIGSSESTILDISVKGKDAGREDISLYSRSTNVLRTGLLRYDELHSSDVNRNVLNNEISKVAHFTLSQFNLSLYQRPTIRASIEFSEDLFYTAGQPVSIVHNVGIGNRGYLVIYRGRNADSYSSIDSVWPGSTAQEKIRNMYVQLFKDIFQPQMIYLKS